MAEIIIREAGYTGSGEVDFYNPNPVPLYGRVFVQLGTWDDADPPTFTAVATSAGNADMYAGDGSVTDPTISNVGNFDITFPGEEDEYSGIGVFMYGVTPAPSNLAAGLTPPGWIEVLFELEDSVQTVAAQDPTSKSPYLEFGDGFLYNEGGRLVNASFTITNPNLLLGEINIEAYGFASDQNAFSVRQVPTNQVLGENESQTLSAKFALNAMQANQTQDPVTITGWVEWSPNWTRSIPGTHTASGLAVGTTTLYTLIQPEFTFPAFTST